MITAGLKLTHSGGLALLEDDRLIFNIEVQKLANNARYSPVTDLRLIPEILAEHDFKVSDVDSWALDGWDGADFGHLSVLDHGTPVDLKVAPYRENDTINSLVRPGVTGELPIGGRAVTYNSYVHMSSHFAAAYCSSPFAAPRASSPSSWSGTAAASRGSTSSTPRGASSRTAARSSR